MQRLVTAIAAAEKEQAPLHKKLAPLQQKAAALEEQIENAGGAPLKKQREAVAALQKVRASVRAHRPAHSSIRRPKMSSRAISGKSASLYPADPSISGTKLSLAGTPALHAPGAAQILFAILDPPK